MYDDKFLLYFLNQAPGLQGEKGEQVSYNTHDFIQCFILAEVTWRSWVSFSHRGSKASPELMVRGETKESRDRKEREYAEYFGKKTSLVCIHNSVCDPLHLSVSLQGASRFRRVRWFWFKGGARRAGTFTLKSSQFKQHRQRVYSWCDKLLTITCIIHKAFPRTTCWCHKTPLNWEYIKHVLFPQGLPGINGRPGAKVRGLLCFL